MTYSSERTIMDAIAGICLVIIVVATSIYAYKSDHRKY